jgi:hypothetical protein
MEATAKENDEYHNMKENYVIEKNELIDHLNNATTELENAKKETQNTIEQCNARLAVHENQAKWFLKATTTLKTKLKAVHTAGTNVASEVKTQISSMSIDFAELSKQVVQAVSQLTTQKDEAVKQYRREQRSRQKVFNELQRRRKYCFYCMHRVLHLLHS